MRLFTFGCSYTKYSWPTWADIVGVEYNSFQNWGEPSSSNMFIFFSLIECIKRNNINKDDYVAIMFTTLPRYVEMVDNKWHHQQNAAVDPTQILRNLRKSIEIASNVFGSRPQYYESDINGLMIKTAAIIDSIRLILDGIGCKYDFLSLVEFDFNNQVKSLYADSINLIKPSAAEVLFNSNFESRPDILVPESSNWYCLEEKYNLSRGLDWPTYEKFIQGNFNGISQNIIAEIKDFGFYNWLSDLKNTPKSKLKFDPHPTPLGHFEYLEKVGFTLSERQKKFAIHWDKCVKTGRCCYDINRVSSDIPVRFGY